VGSDPSNVDAAVIAVLANDPALAALLPDGVFMDVAPAGTTRFVIVSQMVHEDSDAFHITAFERFEYLVKAVALDTSGVDISGAAVRIHELLQRGLLTITGYAHMSTVRSGHVHRTEVDAIDSDIRWQHRGGLYEITVSPN
jgi:hypothetical protein